jgi:carbamoyl-phosphate synthase large subunit
VKGLGRAFLPSRPDRVLVLGSGALQIAQAGEFDYSGSQAIKALKEEGVFTVLVNPNIATLQTSQGFADQVYFLPVTPEVVEEAIVRERIDAILLSFGGQTALNCGLALDAAGVFRRHGVRVLGTPIAAIRATEDRQLFAEQLTSIGVSVARSRAVTSAADGAAAAREIGLPVILRTAFTLGGRGAAIVRTEPELLPALERAFSGVEQVLVEECLAGWKEIEYEVVRDGEDNCIAVCNMENVDPMGIHTGDSIVVAPSQTLNDAEYQLLRTVSLKTIRHLGVVGECNIQFALNPARLEYRVIEVNARLSRSSALASKATGYPLAHVAAKIALGYTLPQISNAVTRTTTAFFEPALDYIVCKVPRWDFDKFEGANAALGPEMKSVGEVMAIGRCFTEALQKALRMLEIGVTGLDPAAFDFADWVEALRTPSPRRMFAVAHALERGISVAEVARLTAIDPFFLHEIADALRLRRELPSSLDALGVEQLHAAKKAGFSDLTIARGIGKGAAEPSEEDVRRRRWSLGVRPRLAHIDTLAAEYPAATHYLYFTYAAQERDAPRSEAKKLLVLGSGCYRIGSSVEFDWCSVGAVRAARELGFETLLLNCNPETVSTDYDACDALVFDELSLETVLELCDEEKPEGVLVSVGGQTSNTLAMPLHRAGVRILGTSPESIDTAEDRKKFSLLCDSLGIAQPRWAEAGGVGDLKPVVEALGGFPVLVRPSYVLSGAAMRVAHSEAELKDYLARATRLSPEHPVVFSKFEAHAREIELDAVAQEGRLVLWAISEHVEDAGVHSGDATLVLPPEGLNLETVREVKRLGAALARALEVSGPFNVQILALQNEVKVIECNLRASRSLPFVSKVLGHDFIREATRVILGAAPTVPEGFNPLELDYVGVKAPQFSFRRLAGVDPVLRVEMASTGEVGCLGDSLDEALLKAMMSSGFRRPRHGVLLSLGPVGDKYRFADEARALQRMGLRLFATAGTAEVLHAQQISCETLDKEDGDGALPRATDVLRRGDIDLVINVPREYDERGRPDGFLIRRCAVDLEIPLITDLRLARKVVLALSRCPPEQLRVKPWRDYLQRAG